MEIIHKEESYRIMGACFEVYRELGYGFLDDLKATGYRLGLLVNFGFYPKVEYERIVY